MSGILSGVRVLDLGRGMAGAVTSMLLADHGADVVRIERPGDHGTERSGDVVWNRGKRLLCLDLSATADRQRFLGLAAHADVVLASLRPGVTERLGVDPATLLAVNSSLVYASISGYGRNTPDEHRPGIEWLVTARTGLQWDQRGYYGTRMDHIMGVDLERSEYPVPPGAEQTGCREGPIFLSVPWASMGAALLTLTGISAGLFVRDRTGCGQVFETSLAQAAIMENAMGWQRVAAMHPSYRLWYFDRRAPKGIFRAADGAWFHQFAPIDHDFIRRTARGDEDGADGSVPPPRLGSGGYEEAVRFQVEAHEETAAAAATLPRAVWIDRLASTGRAGQPIRSPEEALLDDALADEGVIVEVDDPVHGPIRQVGHIYGFDGVRNPTIRPRRVSCDHAAEVEFAWSSQSGKEVRPSLPAPRAPLDGIIVLDFGLAIAGPYGPQVLADLGADVIKVTTLDFDLTDAIYVGSSRGKQALALDLKHPTGQEIAARLMTTADVIHHNMRTGVAERLGIGYEQARRINPSVIYCHTRGFERNGPRTALPGNDQMGHALTGTAYEAGGTVHGTAPIWQMIGFGDTGNGIASAAAVVQALRDRDQTGEGRFVHTSILNTCMLFNSYTYVDRDGVGPARDRIDAGQYGFSALRRLYETATEWICIHVDRESEWKGLCDAVGRADLLSDPRFASRELRAENDLALAAILGASLRDRDAATWCDAFDRAGVPAERASSTYARELFDDPDARRRGWVVGNEHAHLEFVEQVGMPWSFSVSDAANLAGSPVTGQHSRPILRSLGYDDETIDEFVAGGVVRIDTECETR